MAYFPKSRIITNQKSNPGEFTTKDGKEYLGDYYITYDGKYFTGANPQSNSFPLTKMETKQDPNNRTITSKDTIIFDYLNKNNINISELIEPTPHYPKPTEEDFKIGKITRYFARQRIVRKFKLIEINKDIYEDIINQRGVYNYPMWKVISIFWRISPSLSNEKLIHKHSLSILEDNKRIIEQKEKVFQGLKQYITNYEQFSKP